MALPLLCLVLQPDVRVADGDTMKLFNLLLIAGIAASAAVPARAEAQGRDSAKRATTSVPVEARPPKGMCRIWIEGVPSAQQPAATDCATAVKNRPTNGRVIFGDDFADTTKAKGVKLPPNMNGFSGSKPATPPVVPKRPPE